MKDSQQDGRLGRRITRLATSRRGFISGALAAAAVPVHASVNSDLRIGTMDTVLKKAGQPEALTIARRLGLSAVQVTLGVSTDGKTLPLEDRQLQLQYRSASRQQKMPHGGRSVHFR